MSSKKKDLEIIFNLQWKNGPKVAERSNMVGVYDIPSTTLNWELFKSYILKNSGTPGDDVKVSYLEHGREFPIESTLDFHTALYSFRKKAMNGEIINLRLESLSNCNKSSRYSPTCDAQTECCYDYKMDRAPEWFVDYMAEFKKEILNEVATAITTHAAVFKTSFSHSHYPRKSKTECAKRSRKNHHHDGNEKEVLRTIKMENKLQSKMEKLVNKSKKLEKKKISLITKSSDSDAGHSSSKSNSETISTVDVSKMNAAPIRCEESNIPHLMGGEVYRHCWKVINNGLSPWTEDTELHFSWGSSLLEPIQRVLPCPLLNPGDIGIIEALVHVPKICGKYQMYWHFHHKGRRFGHWLGCQIIVDKINSAEQLSTSFLKSLTSRYDIPSSSTSKIQSDFKTSGPSLENISILTAKDQMLNNKGNSIRVIAERMKELQISGQFTVPLKEFSEDNLKPEIEELIINKSPSKIQIIENYFNDGNSLLKSTNVVKSAEFITNVNSSATNIDAEEDRDSHSESISKIDEDTSSNSTLNDMVMVNFPEEVEQEVVEEIGDYHSESISRIEEDRTSISTLNNMVMVGLPDDLEQPEILGYAYVLIDGIKTPVPKKYLRSDFLETAEEAPEPKKNDDVCYTATMRRFLEMKYDDPNNCEHKRSIHDDNEDYDDIPDLVPSDPVDNSTNISSEKKTSPTEIPSFPSLSFSRRSRNDVMNNEIKGFEDSDFDEEDQTTLNDIKQKQMTPHSSVSTSLLHLQNQTVYEEQKALNPTADGYTGNVNIYPTIHPNDSHPRVPNYQQTPPELRLRPIKQEYSSENTRITYTSNPEMIAENAGSTSRDGKIDPSSSFPQAVLVTEPSFTIPISSVVKTMASSALKSVVDKIIPSKKEEEHGTWLNGHWVPAAENSIRENNLKILADMGFKNRDLNATLLARYDDDMRRVVAELVQ